MPEINDTSPTHSTGPRDVVLCGVAGLLVIMAVIGFPYGLWASGGILLGTAWVIWKLSAASFRDWLESPSR
jgi:hypothetical protein